MSWTPNPQHDTWFRAAADTDCAQSYGRLFTSLYSGLCEFARKYVSVGEDAEEIVSEVFLRVWKKRKDLVLSGPIHYYLLMAVRNQAIDYLRKQSKWQVTELLDGAYLSHEPDIHTRMADQEALQQVERLIHGLPPQCQRVFCLSRYEGMKYQEIAVSLGISLKTVETQMSRALKRLRTAYSVH